jgi:hypothetical protein
VNANSAERDWNSAGGVKGALAHRHPAPYLLGRVSGILLGPGQALGLEGLKHEALPPHDYHRAACRVQAGEVL